MTSSVDLEVDFHVDRRGGSGHTHLLRWSNPGEGIIRTWISTVNMASGFGNSGVVGLLVINYREAVRLVGRLRTLASR